MPPPSPTSTARHPSLSHWGAFTALVENGRVVGCEPFALDPAPSPMLDAIPEMVHSPLRIRAPAVRRGWAEGRERTGRDEFVEISWDRAIGLVAGELDRVRSRFGAAAILGGSYGWSSAGRLHHARTLVRRFLFLGGGCVDQVGNYSWGAAQFLLPHVIGTTQPVSGRVTDWPSIVKSRGRIIAFGGLPLKNGQVTSGGAGAHTMEAWLREARAAGVAFTVVSPTRSDTPDFLQAHWVPIRPNTDTALMLGMAHCLVAEGLEDGVFLSRCCTGFERFRSYLVGEADGIPKSPEWASGITRVDPEVIRDLARRAAGNRTLITCAWSLQRAHRGEQPYWMAITLAAMLGQIGLPGGGIAFGHGSLNGVGNPRLDVPGPEVATPANPAGRAIPVARLADMLLHPGEAFAFNGRSDVYPDARFVYWAGGNPFHHHQDLNRLRRAWQKPETIVVHESWWTATARHADIVLPATTPLERNDVGGSSRDRFVLAMHQAIPPVGRARNDYDIFRELAARGGFEAAFTQRLDEMGWCRAIYGGVVEGSREKGVALPGFDEFWAQGFVELPVPERDFVLFEAFRADPVRHPLATPSGRIEIFSETVAAFGYDDCPPHPSWLPPREWLGAEAADRWPLHLITTQPLDRLHSQMDPGALSRRNKVAGRERIGISVADASARGIRSGQVVRVFNARGACLAGAQVDPGVSAGVVVMATGAWYDPSGGPGENALERHGNPNVLTADLGTSRLSQGPSAQSALVEVERWPGEPPEVEAWRPPVLSTPA